MPRNARAPLAALTALAASTAAAAGCGDGPAALLPGTPAALVGAWESRSESVQPRGTWRRTFVVHTDMRTEQRGVAYGLYPDDDAGTLSASNTLYGRLGASPRRYVVHPDSLVVEDRFSGTLRRTVERDFSYWPFDSVSYQVRGEELHLTYYTYPADAPVLTREVLYRVR